MKTTKIIYAIAIAILMSITAVSASHHGEFKTEREKMKTEHKAEKHEMKTEYKEKMIEIMKPYFDKLPKETQDKLNELKAEKKLKWLKKGKSMRKGWKKGRICLIKN